jgi:hypothetical protein
LGTADYTSFGVFGKSTTASAEKGKIVLETMLGELVKHVNMLKKTKNEDLTQKLGLYVMRLNSERSWFLLKSRTIRS